MDSDSKPESSKSIPTNLRTVAPSPGVSVIDYGDIAQNFFLKETMRKPNPKTPAQRKADMDFIEAETAKAESVEEVLENFFSAVQKISTPPVERAEPLLIFGEKDYPDWMTFSQLLMELARTDLIESPDLAFDRSFCSWVSPQIATTYRREFNEDPPRIRRSPSSPFCYPPSFMPVMAEYVSQWLNRRG